VSSASNGGSSGICQVLACYHSSNNLSVSIIIAQPWTYILPLISSPTSKNALNPSHPPKMPKRRLRREVFLGILSEACDLVRSDSSPAILERVDAFLSPAVHFGYEGGDDGVELFDYTPSFAHCEEFPEVKDTDYGSVAGMGAYRRFAFPASELCTHYPLPLAYWQFKTFVSYMQKGGILLDGTYLTNSRFQG
jgi:hypothetical protein